ncbi:MAG: nucleotidyltransferase domain-containing protein [Ignavibacteriae bacterium]|nr:nucleotidyltransferase domain-containing protein [Ignavibacteriota bacterium]
MNNNLPIEIQQLIANYEPEKVILFGSHADGTSDEHSDFDFLIIKETETPRLLRRGEALKNARRTVPLDLIILTPAELHVLQAAGVELILQILETGKTIYERDKSMVEFH